jgi:hypothetical protein
MAPLRCWLKSCLNKLCLIITWVRGLTTDFPTFGVCPSRRELYFAETSFFAV